MKYLYPILLFPMSVFLSLLNERIKNHCYPDRNKLYLLQLTVFLIGLSIHSYAQLNSGNLTQLTEKDGLSSNTVNRVLIDKLGYLWISTYNGLVRYNGYEFEKFYSNPNDTSAIQGMIAYDLHQDQKGHIWVGTNPSFIEEYNPETKTFNSFNYDELIQTYDNQIPQYGYFVNSICEDLKENLYFGISAGVRLHSGLLYKAKNDPEIRLFETPDSIQLQNVIQIKNDQGGNIWILSWSGLFKVDTIGIMSNQTDLLLSLPREEDDFVTDFDFSKYGTLWLVSRFGKLYDYNLNSGEYHVRESPYFIDREEDRPTCLIISPDDEIWIGTASGLEQFNSHTDSYSKFDTGEKKELRNGNINCLTFDPSGGLYIGTDNMGLLRYKENPVFTSFFGNNPSENALLPGWVNVIYEASDGMIWIHSDGGLERLNPRSGKIEAKYSNSLIPKVGYMMSFWEHSPGNYYFGHGADGILQLFPSSQTIRKVVLPGIPEEVFVNTFLKDQEGNEWIGSREGLYLKPISTSRYEHLDLSGLEGGNSFSNDILGLVQSGKGNLWILTNNGLFYYNSENKKIERHGYDKTKGDVFVSQDINAVLEDKERTVWVGQWQGGLARYNPQNGQIKHYNLDDGLPSMSIQSILEDEKNNTLWLSTFNGLSRFDIQNEQFNNYSIDDGIQSSLFADGSCLKTSDGTFIFGGSNGITLFHPDDFNIEYSPPEVFLTDLKIFNESVIPGPNSVLDKPVYETEQLVLKHFQNNLTLEFIAIHYANPTKNRYAYILENFDDEWRETVNQRQAFYPNLPFGKYIFRVKAANDKGVWNETGATLLITITPPWWQSWAAYLGYGFLLIGMVIQVHRYQKRKIIITEREKARNKELEQARAIEKAYGELKATQSQLVHAEKMASLGELTAGIAHEIQNPLNFVNNFSELNEEMLADLKQELETGNLEEVKGIVDGLTQNEAKIKYHGKRAEEIVKSMLQHSRESSGTKEITDINVLCDEYLRLAYHGMRAKDKSFHAKISSDLYPKLPKIKAVPQDIGRVLLNLINNAFQAIKDTEKPEVLISTRKHENEIEICVTDNGPGIPGEIRTKIFQPFFTTKPTGQGTGLGLSLSYEIITKGHGGSIEVESKKESGTSFHILLPI